MSDLLNKASLVMIPSGYKEDTVYSVVPSDGSGDLSFTRASNGTRINSAGLVEDVPWNLAQQSEMFADTYWNKVQATITANSTTAPNGTLTADTFAGNGVSDGHYIRANAPINLGTTYTLSIYAKKNTNNFLQITYALGFGTNEYANFDLNNGVTGTIGSGATATITNVGDGWYRCTITSTATSSTTSIAIAYALITSATSARVETNTLSTSVYIYGAQLNIGSTAKPYFPTTDRLNVPRLTYQNGGGGCPSLLLEKQSTNLATYSEQFDNAAWTKNNTTVTANATTSPDGTSNADKIADSINTSSAFYFYQSPATTSTQYTSSGYFKKGEYNFVTLHAFGLNGAVFNLNTGVLVSQSGGTGTIQSVGDGWYRCTFTFTAAGSAVFFSQSPAGNISYTGTIGSGIYGWGLQLEASSYPTSYIPTTSASATRVADACSKTGISSLIGSTTGSVFVDFELYTLGGFEGVVEIINTSSVSQRFLMWRYNNGLDLYFAALGTYFSTPISIGRHKACFTYTPSVVKFFVDGVKIGQNTSTGSITGGFDKLDFEHSDGGVYIEKKNIYESVVSKTAFTEAEAIALTTI